jgi:hypothetical protein
MENKTNILFEVFVTASHVVVMTNQSYFFSLAMALILAYVFCPCAKLEQAKIDRTQYRSWDEMLESNRQEA